jgi:hypothetical protein
MDMKRTVTMMAAGLALSAASPASDEAARFWQSTQKEDYTIDREPVFEFVKKPVVPRHGDRVTVAFETKGFCDVTLAIEDTGGRWSDRDF